MKIKYVASAVLGLALLSACGQNSTPQTVVTPEPKDTTAPGAVSIQEVLVITERGSTTTSAASLQQLQEFAANAQGGSNLQAQNIAPLHTPLPAGFVVKYAVKYVAPVDVDVDLNTFAVYVDNVKVDAAKVQFVVVGVEKFVVVTTPLTVSGRNATVAVTVKDKAGNESAKAAVTAEKALSPSHDLAANTTDKTVAFGTVATANAYAVGIFGDAAAAARFNTGKQLWSHVPSPAAGATSTTVTYPAHGNDGKTMLGQTGQAWSVLAQDASGKAFSIAPKNF